MTNYSGRSKLEPPQGNEKRNGRVEKCNTRKDRLELGHDGQKDGLTLHSSILECPVPSKFRLPQLEVFDGLKDPLDHLNTFKTTLGLQHPPNEILCRSFPTTLKGATREWFTNLPTSSIDTFEQLGSSFIRHFVRGQRPKRPTNHLLTIRQGKKETSSHM